MLRAYSLYPLLLLIHVITPIVMIEEMKQKIKDLEEKLINKSKGNIIFYKF